MNITKTPVKTCSFEDRNHLSGLENLEEEKSDFLEGVATEELLLYLYSNSEVIFVGFLL